MLERNDAVFVYFSEAFFRNLASPAYQSRTALPGIYGGRSIAYNPGFRSLQQGIFEPIMPEPVLTVEQSDEAVAIVTLNRPERRNALSIELMETLCHRLDAFASQPRLRVVILRAAGPAFCAGLDLVEAAHAEVAEHSSHCVARTFQTLFKLPQITIAAVHGAAYAGGAGLMASCDFIVAANDLKVCFPEVRRGLVPALATVALGARLRDGDRRQLLLLGEPVEAAKALEIGLVDRIVPGEQLMTAAREIADTILKGAPDAVRYTKRLLRDLAATDRQQHITRALELHNVARASAEAQEGMAAFRERRAPNW